MKNRALILILTIVLALTASSCGALSVPPTGPQGLQPGGDQPQGPQPGSPQPGGPQPGGPQPGGPQPGGPQSGGPQPGGPQPVIPTQQQPTNALPQPTKQPPTAKPMPTANSGGNLAPTATIAIKALQAQIVNLDLAVTNIYPASTGHIMVTLKNVGNVNISGSYKVTCSGSYADSGGNHALSLSGQYASVNLKPEQKADFDTSYSRNPSITEMWVSCKVTPPLGDTNSSNDSMGMTQVK